MFPHRNIHKYTWTFPEAKTDNQIDHILADRSWHSNILDVRSVSGANFGTDQYLVVAKIRKRFAISKQAARKLDRKDLILGS